MNKQRIDELLEFFSTELLENTMPFWMKHAPDKEFGGYFTTIGRDGQPLSSHKNIWIHGRFIWLLSHLYSVFEPRQEWLDMATHGMSFLDAHGFDENGKMYFTLARNGKPIRMRRYVFSEVFGVMAYAEYYRATQDKKYLEKALAILASMQKYSETPGLLEPKYNPETFATKGHSMTMIQINVLQVLRDCDPEGQYNHLIDKQIKEVFDYFVKEDERVLLETVGIDGSILRDTPEGRTVNPGHAIETAWFMLEEAKYRGDAVLQAKSLQILDWALERGWDTTYGGLLSFVDLDYHTPLQVEHDMKYWWPHNEAIYALLLAYSLTGDAKYDKWFEKMFAWSEAHFPDREYGEWFGYLRRDGSVSVDVKATGWKGPFHLPRQQLNCVLLLREMKKRS